MTPAQQLISELYPETEPAQGREQARFGPGDIGRIRLHACAKDRIWISNIIIEDHEMRGQGHGSREMSRITQAADALGVDICLEAFWRPGTPDGGALQRWYDAHGFNRIGIPDDQDYQELERSPIPPDPFPSSAEPEDKPPSPG